MTIKKHIPNMLTGLRMVLTILLMVIICQRGLSASLVPVIGITLSIYVTDMMDGRLARKWSACTAFGERMDIVADLFYILSQSFIMVRLGVMPWLIIACILLEFSVFTVTSMLKLDKGADRSFYFEAVGRVTAVYYYSLPLIYFILGSIGKNVGLTAGFVTACCVLLTTAALYTRLNLVLGQQQIER